MKDPNINETLAKISSEIKELREQIAILQMEQSDLNFKWLIADSDCYISKTTPENFESAINIYTKLMYTRKALFVAKVKLSILSNSLNSIYGNFALEESNENKTIRY